MPQVKAIALDFGGVLFAEGKSVAVARLARDYAYDGELVSRLLVSPQSKDLRKGLIRDHEFWGWVQDQLPQACNALTVRRVWYESYILDHNVLDLLQKLKHRYRLIAFSDNIRSRVDYLERKYHFRRLFEEEVYSFDFHSLKPDKNLIGTMIQVSRCSPREIVYVDDSPDCAGPARDLGINFILYAQPEFGELEKALGNLGIRS
jgi:FMN phosphatase YigB (HAD superfamily)